MLSTILSSVKMSQLSIFNSLALFSLSHPPLKGCSFCAYPDLNAAMYKMSGYLQLIGAFFLLLVTNHFLCSFCITCS